MRVNGGLHGADMQSRALQLRVARPSNTSGAHHPHSKGSHVYLGAFTCLSCMHSSLLLRCCAANGLPNTQAADTPVLICALQMHLQLTSTAA